MPELPEVETYVRELDPLLRGKHVTGARVLWPRIVAHPEASTFVDEIQSRRFVSFDRRGKYMLFGLDNGDTLIVHLRMTGELRVQSPGVEPDKHTHAILDLNSGEQLHYRDQRKFGRIWLVGDPKEVVDKLGPEPLGEDFEVEGLRETLSGRTASIKALLLDQSIVAGVGNIYADEALFRARIDPRRQGGSLSEEEVARLHEAVRFVLRKGIQLRGSTLGRGPQNYAPPNGIPGDAQSAHLVFRRTGEPCLDCGSLIERVVLAQRSTHFCPNCQQ